MRKKWIAATIVLGMAVSGSAGVYAGAKLEQIKAYLNHGLGIEVNGSAYALKDGNGKRLAPISYEGLTYLPVRAVSDALGVPVVYDAATYKVRIGSNSTAVLKRPQYLPADFPIPFDAVLSKSIDSVADGIKKVTLVYSTQESLDTMGFVYKEYVRIKTIANSTQSLTAKSVLITGQLGGTSPISIKGGAASTKAGYNEFTIIWSEF